VSTADWKIKRPLKNTMLTDLWFAISWWASLLIHKQLALFG
jgi:hypothetical protein